MRNSDHSNVVTRQNVGEISDSRRLLLVNADSYNGCSALIFWCRIIS